jgi:hypothetical protein
MKKTILYFCAFAITFASFSCVSDNNENATDETLKTRALPENENAEESTSASFAFITQKWELGEEYITFNEAGDFDAVLEGIHITGRWGLTSGTDDQKMLKLIGKEADSQSEANTFNKTYELVDLSYDRLVAVDGDGKKINFFPQKK